MTAADRPTSPQELPRLSDANSFIYLERCRIDREDLAVAATDAAGTVPIPVATISTLLLGPGTRITHRAVMTLADHGCAIVWVGEHGVRYYANGTGINRSSRLAERQAEQWANPVRRHRMARTLYQIRFPGEDVAKLSLAQLRGREGARVRRSYREASRATGVPWNKRSYERSNWSSADPINQALSVANACLYGISHAAITALGLHPGLGFIHTGDRLSFVYDIADLYKADTTIPAAFNAIAAGRLPIEQAVRRACRDMFHRTRLIEHIAVQLTSLFGPPSDATTVPDDTDLNWQTVWLWDGESRIPGGTNFDRSDDEWS